MNTIILQLLADRNGIPAALLLAADAPHGELPPAVAQPLAQLAVKFPCHFQTGLAEPSTLPLRQAGWTELPLSGAYRSSCRHAAGDGTWSEGGQAKPCGNQAASRALALELVRLVNADADTHEIEELLRRDPTLSYHLLRLVNSLHLGAARKVTSFAQAILILGRQQLRRWLNLMLFAAREGDARSAMLLARVSVRARLMELLARATGLDKHNQEQGFMTGMFSLLGELFGTPLPEVLAPLAIGDAVQRALLGREGELGALLALVEAAEQGDFVAVAAGLEAAQLPPAQFSALVAEANLWMLAVTGDLKGRAHA